MPSTPPALPSMGTLLGPLLDTLLPQTCVACNEWIPADQAPACPTCLASLEAAAALPYCPFCGRTMSPFSIHEKNCARCKHEHFWNVAGVARVGNYSEEPLRHLLVDLKFGGRERQANFLGKLLAAALRKQTWLDEIEALVPVPMHLRRRLQRPCDHARMLAEAVSRRVRIPIRHAAIRRMKYSISQMRTSSPTQRFKNVKDNFGPAQQPKVAGQTVCIIDNLLVTGATIHEVSKVLRKAGAKRIYAAVVARATMPSDPQARPEALPPAPDQTH